MYQKFRFWRLSFTFCIVDLKLNDDYCNKIATKTVYFQNYIMYKKQSQFS